ncbi:MAG: hypothetical protein LBR30_07740, partial [Clostridioides sp.]|nr:hypothetical protein [Clostridioides sp.]
IFDNKYFIYVLTRLIDDFELIILRTDSLLMRKDIEDLIELNKHKIILLVDEAVNRNMELRNKVRSCLLKNKDINVKTIPVDEPIHDEYLNIFDLNKGAVRDFSKLDYLDISNTGEINVVKQIRPRVKYIGNFMDDNKNDILFKLLI